MYLYAYRLLFSVAVGVLLQLGMLVGIDAEVNHDVDWPTADIALFTRTL